VKFAPALSSQFKKDYKLCGKRHFPLDELDAILNLLLDDKPLAAKHKAHVLKGSFEGHWECHIRPDWLLIWVRDPIAAQLYFVRTGTHSDLFD